MRARVVIVGNIQLPAKDMQALAEVGPLEVVQTLLMHDCPLTVELDVKRGKQKVEAAPPQGGQAESSSLEEQVASGEQESQPATE